MKNIVLIGFTGTGKTTTGRLLAARLGRQFIDVDKKIELENELSISEIFARFGEEYFRRKEIEMIARVSRYRRVVIATGGGAVLFPENIARLKQGSVLIALTASLEVILERTGRRTTRPLFERPDREEYITRLLRDRQELYQIADYTVDTSVNSPLQVTSKIIAYLRKGGHLRS
ncbi:MAG: AAA family ATPase [Negativicutes bacterium]|nr:AAA family ATPase [Negativicutes bacterium]